MSYHDRLIMALKFATNKHAGQLRKGTKLPYIVHPIEVAMILQQMRCQTDTVIAGFLHDTIEDTDTTVEEIAAIFGSNVASMVEEVSESDKSLALIKAKTYSAGASMLKMADLASNIDATYSDFQLIGDAIFDRFTHGKATLDHYKLMTNQLAHNLNTSKSFQQLAKTILVKITFMMNANLATKYPKLSKKSKERSKTHSKNFVDSLNKSQSK